eukprot:Skav234034  [mRNA]  locus=scaffold2485:5120:7207:+ [translate_table: standard]
MSSSSSSSKRPKLEQLQKFKAKLPAHSQAALAAIVEEIKESGLPEASSEKEQREARRLLIQDSHGGGLGPLIQQMPMLTSQGSHVQLAIANFLVFIQALFARGGSFHAMLRSKFSQNPSSIDRPWSLILYLDEVIPGNVLGRAERKSWAFYASFLQFGDQLCHHDAWLTLAIARTKVVSTLEAGPSQIMATILKMIFTNPIVDPTLGYLLKSPTGDVRIHFRLGMVLADGAAQKQAWGSKGDSGSKFCQLCANVRATGSPTSPDLQHHNVQKYSQLVLTTDAQVLQSYAQLHARASTCTKQDFEMWQQATGWTYSHKAMLIDPDLLARDVLKPVSQFCHDYMHGILLGTGPLCLYQFLVAVEPTLAIWPFLEGYFQYFQFPKAWSSTHIHTFFSKKKVSSHKASEKISCQASELLAMFPIVRHFVHAVARPQGLCEAACQALLAMATAIDHVHYGNQAGLTTREALLQAMENAIATFTLAFPNQNLIKKWHWTLHLADSFARFGVLPNCFATERKHKPIGRMLTSMYNQTNFETTIMEHVLAHEISTLDQPNLFPEGVLLTRPVPASKKVLAVLNQVLQQQMTQDILCSQIAKVKGINVHKGDVVAYHVGGHFFPPWQVAEVQFHVSFHGTLATLVKSWEIKEYFPQQQFAKCLVTSELAFVPTQDIIELLVFSKPEQNHESKILLPFQIYSKDL